jgi:hypothetical protein
MKRTEEKAFSNDVAGEHMLLALVAKKIAPGGDMSGPRPSGTLAIHPMDR